MATPTNEDQRWFGRGRGRTVASIVVALLVCGAATAGAANLITGKDIKEGSIPRGDLKKSVQNSLPIRITKDLPTNGFSASNGTVSNSPDGVEFGPSRTEARRQVRSPTLPPTGSAYCSSYNGTLPMAAATTGVKGLEAIIPIAPNTSYYHYYRSNGLVRNPGGWVGEDIDFLFDYINSGIRQPRVLRSTRARRRVRAPPRPGHGDYNDFWATRDCSTKLGTSRPRC